MRNRGLLWGAMFLALFLALVCCTERKHFGETVQNGVFERLQRKKYDKISQNFYRLGISSYKILDDKIIFESFKNFNVNGYEGNMSERILSISKERLVMGEHSIGVENGGVFVENKLKKEVLTDVYDLSKLDNDSKLLLIVFIELFGKNIDKKNVNNFEEERSGCSWMNTYYISGWGKTPSAAWADYHHNSSSLSGLPSGGKCRPLGDAHLSKMVVDLYVLDFELYQVDRAFCCN